MVYCQTHNCVTEACPEHCVNHRKSYKEIMSETRPKIPARLGNFEVAFDDFTAEMKRKVIGQAKEKGYITGNEDSGRNLYDFIDRYIGNHGHAIGEIIYKAVRFSRRKDPQDIVKVAAWAFLVWDSQRRDSPAEKEVELQKGPGRAHIEGTPCKNCNMSYSAHADGYCQQDCSKGLKYEPKF